MNDTMAYMMDPGKQMRLWAQMTRIGIEAQLVIGLRLAGMAGLTRQAPSEPMRMVTEKQEAVVESIYAMVMGTARGDSAETVMNAALKPYARRTRANSRRLSRRRPG